MMMVMHNYFSCVMAIGVLIATPITVKAQSQFSMNGDWSSGSDCPITFYRDDGHSVEGNCDNGTVNHVVLGTYSSPNRIDITIKRIDPNQCETSVPGYIQVINENTVKYWQQGWNGCGVRTPPATQRWSRKS
jgi:hypothetical protein